MPHHLRDLAGSGVSAEGFLGAVLEVVAQPVWVVDAEGRIRFVSSAAVAALGYGSAGELVGRHCREVIRCRHPDGRLDSAADWPMRLPGAPGEDARRDVGWFVRRDGSVFPAGYVSMPVEMPEGCGVVVAFSEAGGSVRGERWWREQEAMLAAQRRVDTLVAGGAASGEVFAAIAKEVGHVTGLPMVAVWRYEPGGARATVVGAWGEVSHPFQAGTTWPLDGPTVVRLVKNGRPGRVDGYAGRPGMIAAAARESGMGSVAGAPVVVDGEIWGVLVAASTDRQRLPDRVEDRLAEFTELVTVAIANAESRAGLARLAEEQAALRRVATLVARGVPPSDVFSAVAREVGLLLGVDATYLARYDADGTAIGVASWSPAGGRMPVALRVTLEGESVTGIVSRTGRPARMDSYEHAAGAVAAQVRESGLGSSVGAPIVVDQRLWGVIVVSFKQGDRTLPPDTESRVALFAELVATAISNTESRIEVTQLAEEQAALRRVATRVARGVPEGELFGAVIAEVGRLFGADVAGMIRYDSGGAVTPVASWAAVGEHPPWLDPWPTDEVDPALLIWTTRRAVRIDWRDVTGGTANLLGGVGIRSSVVSPVLADGRLWGALAVHTRRPEPFPPDTESRLKNFTELVATAISNIEARAELAASRARVVEAADEERRRVVRDLHDGAQQRLVHTIITLKHGHKALENGQEVDVSAVLTEALDHAQHAIGELRELAHGILPAVLAHGGLRAAVTELASRMPMPVENQVSAGRLPATIEATAYFVVAEALTNIAKHSRARHATVTAGVEDGSLRVRVRDDGIGGARPDGSGLLGMADRLAAVGGQLQIESPADGGTLIAADIPVL